MHNPFRYFNSSPEVIRLTVMMHVRYPLSLRQVEDSLFERDIDICHETIRFCWNRFGPMFANSSTSSKLVSFEPLATVWAGWTDLVWPACHHLMLVHGLKRSFS